MSDDEPRLILRQEDLVWRVAEEHVVTVDLPTEAAFAINGTGALLWGSLQGGTTRSELIELLCDRYGISTEQAGDDVDDFVSKLAGHGLLA
jgi:hypothetical protein